MVHVLVGLEATGICVDQTVFEVVQQHTVLGQRVASATDRLRLVDATYRLQVTGATDWLRLTGAVYRLRFKAESFC